jgi:hypothetical protein
MYAFCRMEPLLKCSLPCIPVLHIVLTCLGILPLQHPLTPLHIAFVLCVRLHLGIKPFLCETCGRRFRTTGNRAAHQCEPARQERAAKRKKQIAERREMREQIRDGSFPYLQDPLYVSEKGKHLT